jgi:hypothetical protein
MDTAPHWVQESESPAISRQGDGMNREAFEKWWSDPKTNRRLTDMNEGRALYLWKAGWQAALQSGEPVAYAVFADNGNIRIWCADPIQAEALKQQYGDSVVPLYTTPQPVVPEWIEGAPEVGTYAILHIPLKSFQDHCIIGFLSDDGAVYDMCGDGLGFYEDDIERWTKLIALLSAGKGTV